MGDSEFDKLKLSYEAVRTEMMVRFRLREQLLAIYLGAAGVLSGVAFNEPGDKEILLIIPFFALGVTLLICRHEYTITRLSHFCSNELRPFFAKVNPVPQWDGSQTVKKGRFQKDWSRIFAQLIIIGTPCGFSIKYSSNTAYQKTSICLLVICVSCIVYTWLVRRKQSKTANFRAPDIR